MDRRKRRIPLSTNTRRRSLMDFGYFERYELENALARKFYQQLGYIVSEGYDFNLSQHPTEIAMLSMAKIAIDEISDICVEKMSYKDEDDDC